MQWQPQGWPGNDQQQLHAGQLYGTESMPIYSVCHASGAQPNQTSQRWYGPHEVRPVELANVSVGPVAYPYGPPYRFQAHPSTCPSTDQGCSTHATDGYGTGSQHGTTMNAPEMGGPTGIHRGKAGPRKTKNQDGQKAKQAGITIPVEVIVDMSTEDMARANIRLNDNQKLVLADIRRRGRNKVSARDSRAKKIKNIETLTRRVEDTATEILRLKRYHEQLDAEKQIEGIMLNKKKEEILNARGFTSATHGVVVDKEEQVWIVKRTQLSTWQKNQ